MENYALGYVVLRFFYRIFDFLRHWYVRGSRMYWHFALDGLEAVDRVFAFKINIKLWFQPLYGDYSVLGYILGFIFRTARIFIGAVVHGAIFFLALLIYCAWVLLPPVLIYGAITGDFLISKYGFIF